MAKEIHYADQSGLNWYAQVERASDGQLYNGSTTENPLTANWTTYGIALTEFSTTGHYYADMPAVAAGLYNVYIYQRLGGSQAVTDGPPTAVISMPWDGTVVVNIGIPVGEPGQGAPPASANLVTKLAYLYKAWRNKKTQTASEYDLFADDATTVDQKATVSSDGTTTTIGEVASGS